MTQSDPATAQKCHLPESFGRVKLRRYLVGALRSFSDFPVPPSIVARPLGKAPSCDNRSIHRTELTGYLMKSLSVFGLLLLSTTLFNRTQLTPAANLSSETKRGWPSLQAAPQSVVSGLSFASAAVYGSGATFGVGVAIGDVNGDGNPDVVVANNRTGGSSSGSVGVLLGNGDGTLQAAVVYESGGFFADFVSVADVNGDGKLDILVVNECAPGDGTGCSSAGSIGVLLGNGDGTFQPAVAYGTGGYVPTTIAVSDLNGDGKPDVIVANCGGNMDCGGDGSAGVLIGNGDGTFQTAVAYDSGSTGTESVAVGDVNGDGKPDLIVANEPNSTVGVLLGNGDGTFQAATGYPSGSPDPISVSVADVNNDGQLDVVVVNQCKAEGDCTSGTVGVLIGNGDGSFRPAVTYGSGGYIPFLVAVADVNGDGNQDLVVVNQCGNINNCKKTGEAGVLLGKGDGTFQTPITFGTGGFEARAVTVGDLNGDGKPDLAAANFGTNTSDFDGTVGVLLNTSIDSTTTVLVASVNPSNAGQAVTFTATVTTHGFFKGGATGTVNFFDGTSTLGSSQLNAEGMATLTTSALAAGSHTLTASFTGDQNSAASSSPLLRHFVQLVTGQISQNAINFGNQTIATVSGPQMVLFTNTGNTAIRISSITIKGANAANFTETNNCSSPLAIAASCSIAVSFQPAAVGPKTSTLTIADNAVGAPQQILLTGTGVAPAVSLSAPTLIFPTQVLLTVSAAQTVTLTNTGLGLLDISAIQATGSFSQANDCGSTVSAGSRCTITVTFRPPTKGSSVGSVSITDSAARSPQVVSLRGTGTFVQLTPTAQQFGNQPVNTVSLPKRITLTNKGNAPVNISSVSMTGTNPTDFSQTNTCSKQIASGASCVITVTFMPTAKGKRSGAVSITDDGGGSPQSAGLSGTGT
jgi:hypothetical protein